ncbi:MAG: hypothetical protein IKR61_10340 [Lachnospiraceae bacterium]|nr:hypothetical protein [Lachnospiraceae bacterium]
MTGKRIIHLAEILVFAVALAVLTVGCYRVLKYKNLGSGGGLDNFYQNDAPIDVIAYGSSHAHCTIDNGLLWEEYGIPSFTLSATALTIDGIYYLMEESFRVAPPRIALVETYTFPAGVNDESGIYQTGLPARWSPVYASYALREAARQKWDRTKAEELFFRMPVVHSRYRELTQQDYVNVEPYMRGYRGSIEVTPLETPPVTEERSEIPEESRLYMEKMIELCRKHHVELVFFNASYEASVQDMAAQNTVRDLAEEQGVAYIGFNHDAAVYGIDYSTDLREEGHVNDLGAAKITRALADYCTGHWKLTDRRGEAGYDAWDTHVRFLNNRADRMALHAQSQLVPYLQVLADMREKYTIVLSLKGNYGALGEDAFAPELGALGIDMDAYRRGGTYIFGEGELLFCSAGEEKYQRIEKLNHRNELYVYRDGAEDRDHVALDGRETGEDVNGITILVYDPECALVMDEVSVNVYQGLELLRPEETE